MTPEIQTWLDVGRKNLSEHYRTEFHENLRNPSRDYWTKLFEDNAEAAIARIADLLQEAELQGERPALTPQDNYSTASVRPVL